jgi:cell division protein FtsN
VRIVIIQAPPGAAAPGHFAVQVGAFRDKGNAERVKNEMAGRYGTAKVFERTGSPPVWRVLVGDELSEAGATALAERIRREGAEKLSAFVVRL